MSQFIVSARKYRPQHFIEVVGQEHITTTLKNAIRQNKVAHAFLFCGPRGVGKTTTARILAKTINCEAITDDFEACGECASCVAFRKKNAPNIIELDAASHNSVDDIRNLNEQVRIPPAQGNYKLFIIDEVHMLSIAAFNAFLKTLEEPPPFAIFILATTEKHKILPTILSRCQIYDFKRNSVQDIVPHLEMICQAENLEYNPEALHLIAEKADGALRDALSIFDRMVSFSDGHISYEAVIDQLNILDYDYFFQLTDFLISGDLSSAYLLFNDILEKGFSPEVFLLGFQEHLRQLLMIHLSHTAGLVNGSQELQQRYTNQSTNTSRDFLLTILDLANECDVNFRLAQNKRLHVEISLMKMAYFPHASMEERTNLTLSQTDSPSYSSTKKNTPRINPESEPDVTKSSPSSSQHKITAEETPATYESKEINKTPTPKKSVSPSDKTSISQAEENPDPVSATAEPTGTEKKDQPSNGKNNSNQISQKRTKRKSKSLLPTLNAMEEIIEEVEKNDTENQVIPKDHEIFELIQKAWNHFTENHSSPSLVTFLKDAQLEWKDQNLLITVTSQLAKSSILDQRSLFEDLREASSPHTPEIIFRIDPGDTATRKPPKVLTTKDKFEALKKTNPKLENLIKELNLKIDE